MKYEAIKGRKQDFPVARMCAVLQVSESGYYAWLSRAPSRRKQENEALSDRIKLVWSQFRGIYGAPRIHAELQAQGLCVGRHRVARLMRKAGISGKSACKRRPRTTQSDPTHPVAPNLLD
jgi:transposase InsO family protein